jgi:hypothetical protein
MAELVDSPIVDIRRIRGVNKVIRYVAKYITKAPKQFDGSKRYWNSQNWEPPYEPKDSSAEPDTAKWEVWPTSLLGVGRVWMMQGFLAQKGDGEEIIAYRWLGSSEQLWRQFDEYREALTGAPTYDE